MKTSKKVLPVEGHPGDAGLPREMFDENGSLGVDLACVSFMAEAGNHLRNLPTKVELFREELGR